MEKFIKDHRFIAGLLSIIISVFLVSIVAYGATTINNNIVTGIASTTDSVRIGGDVGNDDDILYFDTSEENLTWDDSLGLFSLSNDLQVTGKTTSTVAMAVGAGGTIDTLDMAGGDLYVLDDLEIDGVATSTDGFYTMGDLDVGGAATIRGATTIGGRTTTTDYIYLPMVHFQQGVATSTAPNEGECFMPNNDLTCYADGAWVYAW